MTQLNFDARTVDPNVAFDPVPAGWYKVSITTTDMKPTSNGNGAYLQLEMTILEGEFAGRKLFDRLNLHNQNPTTVEIAYKTLSAICHATGVIQVQDSNQLCGIPMEAKAVVKPARDGYDANNDIKGYRAVGAGNGQQAGQQGQWQGTPPPPPQANGGAAAPGGYTPPQQPPAQPPQNQWTPPAQPPQQPQQPQAQPPQNQNPPTGGNPQPPQWNAQPQAQPQNQQPQQNQATGAPTSGPAPSANGTPGMPPWAQ